jgi:tetratricopeptide (TPR) repeat protein
MAGRSAVPTLLERGRYGSAAAVLDGLAWIGQDMAGRRLQLGSLLAGSGQPGEGLRHLERSVALDPSPEAFLAIGSVREGSGDWQGAAEAYQAGLGIAPGTPQLVFALGQANRLREAVGER